MVQALNFAKDAESGMYVAEAVVNAACNLHIKFPEAAVVVIQKSTADDSNFALHRKYSVCLYPCVMDEDIAFDVYPKRLRILTAVYPDSAVISISTDAAASQQQMAAMQAQIDEMAGADGSAAAASPAIDSASEVHKFLAGMTNDKTIADVINDSHKDLTPEQMEEVKVLFPTE